MVPLQPERARDTSVLTVPSTARSPGFSLRPKRCCSLPDPSSWDVPRGSCRQLLSPRHRSPGTGFHWMTGHTGSVGGAGGRWSRALPVLGPWAADTGPLRLTRDCGDGTLALWSTATCELLPTRLPEPVHGAWPWPLAHRELACGGQGILNPAAAVGQRWSASRGAGAVGGGLGAGCGGPGVADPCSSPSTRPTGSQSLRSWGAAS